MSPITHFLASWVAAESCTEDRRERLWICLAGLAPDLDGLGLAVDIGNEMLGLPPSQWYAVYHHFLFHGIFGDLRLRRGRSSGGRPKAQSAAAGFLQFSHPFALRSGRRARARELRYLGH